MCRPIHLSDHSLRQIIDDAYVRSLDPEALRGLSVRLLADLKEARDRLNQGQENSSRPPSSRALWERLSGGRDAEAADDGEGGGETGGPRPPTEGLPTGGGEHGPQSR